MSITFAQLKVNVTRHNAAVALRELRAGDSFVEISEDEKMGSVYILAKDPGPLHTDVLRITRYLGTRTCSPARFETVRKVLRCVITRIDAEVRG